MVPKVFLPLLCVLGLGLAQSPLWPMSITNGQPGCRTHYELTRLWRNNYRSELYWECTTLGVPAVSRNCAPGTAFLEHWQTCVPLSMYENTPTYDPPSRPEDPVGPCEPCLPCETGTTVCPCEPGTDSPTTTTTTTTVTPETTTTTTPIPFICTEDRMGLRWAGDTENTYWECYGLYQDPFLISCPPGFVFSFQQQTCIVP